MELGRPADVRHRARSCRSPRRWWRVTSRRDAPPRSRPWRRWRPS